MYERKTRDLCQWDWQDVHPTEYAPDTIRYGDCAKCGEFGLVYRSVLDDESIIERIARRESPFVQRARAGTLTPKVLG